ncbi:hypothetical protein QPK13_13075 [Photorhabdus tasmaniensis]
MTEEHSQIADIDDELIRPAFHIDDGRDHTKRLIHYMRKNYYIHEGICPHPPPAPQVVGVKLTPVKKGKGSKRKTKRQE